MMRVSPNMALSRVGVAAMCAGNRTNLGGTMNRLSLVGSLLVALLGVGCNVVHGSTTTACTVGTGPSQTCVEVWTNVSTSQSITTAENDCTNNGGVVSNACSHDGADGGCKTTTTSSGVSVSTTVWYYSGVPETIDMESSNCAQNGGTWLSP
jgi:hypothetical protein